MTYLLVDCVCLPVLRELVDVLASSGGFVHVDDELVVAMDISICFLSSKDFVRAFVSLFIICFFLLIDFTYLL